MESPAFYQYDEALGEYTGGFEFHLAEKLCAEANFACTFVVLKDLKHRVSALHNNEVDLVIWRLSYTLERRFKIHYVEPFYYSDNA